MERNRRSLLTDFEILKGAKFPIKPEELIASLPEGLNTTCMIGDTFVTEPEVRDRFN